MGHIAQQDAVAVHDGERRQHERGKVGKALMNLLVQPVPLPSKNSVPVLHTECGAREFMMLGNWQIENLVCFEKRNEHGPAFQHHAAHIHFAELLGIGQNNLCARRPRCSFNSGAMETTLRLVAAHIGNDHALGTCLPALANDFGNEFRIGVGSLLGRAIPGDVGLDDHDVLSCDESAHAAEIFESLLDECARLSGLRAVSFHRILRHGEMRPLLVCGDAMISAPLLGGSAHRALAALTEPDTSSCSAGRDASNAQKLQQGLASSERRSLRDRRCVLPQLFVFACHGFLCLNLDEPDVLQIVDA